MGLTFIVRDLDSGTVHIPEIMSWINYRKGNEQSIRYVICKDKRIFCNNIEEDPFNINEIKRTVICNHHFRVSYQFIDVYCLT